MLFDSFDSSFLFLTFTSTSTLSLNVKCYLSIVDENSSHANFVSILFVLMINFENKQNVLCRYNFLVTAFKKE